MTEETVRVFMRYTVLMLCCIVMVLMWIAADIGAAGFHARGDVDLFHHSMMGMSLIPLLFAWAFYQRTKV